MTFLFFRKYLNKKIALKTNSLQLYPSTSNALHVKRTKRCLDNTDMTPATMRILSFNTLVRDTRYRHYLLRHFRFPRYFQLNFLRSVPGDTLFRISENTLRLRRPC